jgi:cobalt-zinc-cadmium efflux system outer membrane protein
MLPALLAIAASARADMTLSNAIATALAGNPELKSAREQITAASGRAQQARVWENPELELSAEDVPINDGGLSKAKNMIGVSQTVPFPGKKSLDGQISQRGITAAEGEYLLHERDLVRSVKTTFYRALAAEQKTQVTTELVALSESLANAAGKRVERGAAGAQESLRAEIELERARADLAAVKRDLNETHQALAALLGKPGDSLGALRGTLSADIPAAVTNATSSHPVLRVAEAKRNQSELELRRARLDPYPDVKFGVAGGYDGATDEALMEFRISLPLPLLDRSQGRKREARALAEIARHDLSATAQRLTRDRAVAVLRLQTARAQVETYRDRILPKAEEALKLVRGGFEAGKFGFLDLLDTQRTLAETRLAYLDRLLELNLAIADLETLAGTTTRE